MESKVERINPYLNVKDVAKSLDYYIDVLGFKLHTKSPNLGIVEHSGHQIYLRTNEADTAPHRVWMVVENLDVLWREVKPKGAIITEEPTNYSWAYQMTIKDLDDNLLIIGTTPIERMDVMD